METEGTSTTAWRVQVWASFLVSGGMTLAGILYMPAAVEMKGFLVMGVLFLTGSCFTLAKTLRDDLEVGRIANRIRQAKAEKLLSEFEKANS